MTIKPIMKQITEKMALVEAKLEIGSKDAIIILLL